MCSASFSADPVLARLGGVLTEIEGAAVAREAKVANVCESRPHGVRLVLVIKGQPDSAVRSAVSHLQVLGKPIVIAENFLKDHRARALALPAGAERHFIGVLQSNKLREIIHDFDVIESVGSERYARLIDEEAAKIGKVQRVFLQINISADAGKSGFSVNGAKAFATQVAPQLRAIEISGVMTITRWYDNPDDARPDFIALRKVGEELASEIGRPLELSMGMSRDFVIAIEEGATLVRVGSAIFGERE